MSDEAPPQEDTPTVDSDTPDIPWQKRYEDLRPEFDRTTQQLKEEQKVWEDEQALIARIAEKHPHLLTDEEEEPESDTDLEDEDEPQPLTRAEFEQWKREQDEQAKIEASNRQFATDLRDLTHDRELSDWGREVIVGRYSQGQFKNRDDLEKAIQDWFAYEDGLREPAEPEKRKKPPHVLPGGKVSTGTPNWDDMSQVEIDRYMAERAAALAQQS